MKAGLLGRRCVRVALPEAIQQRMSGLVCDDFVRQAGIDDLLAIGAGEVAEKQPLGLIRIEGVRIRKRMRSDLQLV